MPLRNILKIAVLWKRNNKQSKTMEALQHFLPQVWFVILGLFLLLYVLLDGFDLGVGILSLTSSNEERRSMLMTSLGNVWDANETWLVLMGGALFGAFPLAYSTILSSLYIPILSGAENSWESQDETMVIRANSIRKSNFSRLAIEAEAGGGLVLGKICKIGRDFCW